MNLRNALLSVLQLFAGFSFFAAAIFFFSLPFLPNVRLRISDALLAPYPVCNLIASVLMTASFVLIGGFYFLNQGRSLRIKMNRNVITIDRALIRKTLDECFRKHFPGQIELSNLSLFGGNKLEIEIRLTPFEENLREELFVSLQKRLVPLLNEKFGYTKPFGLVIKN